jgi:hypothetical protein
MGQNQKKNQSSTQGEKNTLSKFIDDNQKLISVLGVFTALTVFTASLPLKVVGSMLSFMFLTLTLIIWTEVLEKFPKGEATWRLGLFEQILAYSFLGIIAYWLLSYREIWHSIMVIPLAIVIMTILNGIVTYPLKKYNLFDRVTGVKPGKLKIVRHILFFFIILLPFCFSIWLAIVITPSINQFLDSAYVEIAKQLPKSSP